MFIRKLYVTGNKFHKSMLLRNEHFNYEFQVKFVNYFITNNYIFIVTITTCNAFCHTIAPFFKLTHLSLAYIGNISSRLIKKSPLQKTVPEIKSGL